nr:MAG TPA: hypothetical protein [Caudoviricetes sp.]
MQALSVYSFYYVMKGRNKMGSKELKELYFDAYKKFENKCIKLEEE